MFLGVFFVDLGQTTADVMGSLNEIQTETDKPDQANQFLLKLLFSPKLLHSITVTGVYCCNHISCVTSDLIWVSDDTNNLILTDKTGITLHRVNDVCSGLALHTVNNKGELIYINRKHDIITLSTDMQTATIFIEIADSSLLPLCVYWSPITWNLLVTMCYYGASIGKVSRYNQSGQLIQTIQHDNKGLELYDTPYYITENRNGDVIVSDKGAVVVTEFGGRYRFSYTGHPSGSNLWPRGICTDSLSHILLCDHTTQTVQILDKDGKFLSHLLIESQDINLPLSLSYDVNTQSLWVGSRTQSENKVFVYS